MARLNLAEAFETLVQSAVGLPDLYDALSESSQAMGFRYFALTHHVDFATAPDLGIRLHNYPPHWEDWFDERALGRFDPIHRASHVANFGFTWSNVPRMIQLTQGDLKVLSQARRFGIGDGFTVPAHVRASITAPVPSRSLRKGSYLRSTRWSRNWWAGWPSKPRDALPSRGAHPSRHCR